MNYTLSANVYILVINKPIYGPIDYSCASISPTLRLVNAVAERAIDSYPYYCRNIYRNDRNDIIHRDFIMTSTQDEIILSLINTR